MVAHPEESRTESVLRATPTGNLQFVGELQNGDRVVDRGGQWPADVEPLPRLENLRGLLPMKPAVEAPDHDGVAEFQQLINGIDDRNARLGGLWIGGVLVEAEHLLLPALREQGAVGVVGADDRISGDHPHPREVSFRLGIVEELDVFDRLIVVHSQDPNANRLGGARGRISSCNHEREEDQGRDSISHRSRFHLLGLLKSPTQGSFHPSSRTLISPEEETRLARLGIPRPSRWSY